MNFEFSRRLALTAMLMLVGAIVPGTAREYSDDLLAPSNDNFANAEPLTGLSGAPARTTAAATKEPNEPNHGRNVGGASVWFKYVAPGNGVLTIHTSGSSFDTVLAVYRGSSLSNLQMVGENADAIATNWSRVSIGTENGATYYIAVDGQAANGSVPSGSFVLNYSLSNAASNDNFVNATILSGTLGRMLVNSNLGASRESGEPTIGGNSGGRSVWYKLNAPSSGSMRLSFKVDGKNPSTQVRSKMMIGIYSGTALGNLQEISNGIFAGVAVASVVTSPNTTYYIAIDGFDSGQGAEIATFNLEYGPAKSPRQPDFDRDGKADLTVYRPLTGIWYTRDSVTGGLRTQQFGINGDKPLLADIGGDGIPDYTIFRPDTGVWYILDSETGFKAFTFGASGDIPLLRFKNGLINAAVFRPVNGQWWSIIPSTGFNSLVTMGLASDVPLVLPSWPTHEIESVFRPSTGVWYTKESIGASTFQFGMNGDIPVPADYDGDGFFDYAVFRPSTGTWWVRSSSDGGVYAKQFGLAGDRPMPADYDGDGSDEIAVFRPSDGKWWISSIWSNTVSTYQFGQTGDIPVGDGRPQ